MGWQFGNALGNDVTYSTSAYGATGNAIIIAGWWYPTTLTAGRGYWAYGAASGADVGTTTSEIRLKTDNTTDGAWDTSGLGMTVDQWRFLAFMQTVNNTGPAIAWRVWAGTPTERPVLVTVNEVTAPVGNFVGSTSIVTGNSGASANNSFQGWFSGMLAGWRSNNRADDAIIVNKTAGAITQEEEDLAYATLIEPYWRLNRCPERLRYYGNWNNSGMVNFVPSDWTGSLKYELANDDNDPFVSVTYNITGGMLTRGPRFDPREPVVQPNFGNLQRRR